MVNQDKVDEILERHRTGEKRLVYEKNPVTEAGEIFGNLDSQRLINFNTNINSEERRCLIILSGLKNMNLEPFSGCNLDQDFKELSVSLKGKGRQQKADIAQGMIKAKSSDDSFGLKVFQRQPAEGGGKE